MVRLRLLPVLMVGLAALLGSKVGSILRVTEAVAQTPGAAATEKGGASAEAPAQPVRPDTTGPKLASEADARQGPRVAYTRAELELLQGLSARREELDKRTRELDLRESLLQAAEKRVAESLAEIKKVEERVTIAVKQREEERDKQLKSLVRVYETMKPPQAARIFEGLEMAILLGVVERMKEPKLALILAAMDPTKAKELTVELAKGRRDPPQSG